MFESVFEHLRNTSVRMHFVGAVFNATSLSEYLLLLRCQNILYSVAAVSRCIFFLHISHVNLKMTSISHFNLKMTILVRIGIYLSF
jgi:hypothetical protein